MSSHLFGVNSRKGNYSHMENLHAPRMPKRGGLSHNTAPQKDEMQFFGGFGNDYGQKR